jgi:hypothetical protein
VKCQLHASQMRNTDFINETDASNLVHRTHETISPLEASTNRPSSH